MKVTEFIKNLIKADSGYSSKRLSAMLLIVFSIIIPIVCLFLKPVGTIDDSVLILSAQLLVSGCSLLGFTLKEASFSRPVKSRADMVNNLIDSLSNLPDCDGNLSHNDENYQERKKVGSKSLRKKEINDDMDNKLE
jgi:hypothetical protein